MIKNRCSPVSLVLFIAIGAFLICTVSAQAGGPSASAAAGSNAVTASVRSVQPAVSGLFQVKAPRVWNNGVPAFLDTWDAFRSRTSSASLNKAYAFTTIDGLGHEVLYAGVERASSKSPVVFEFSRLEGARSVGDLRIEAEIDNAGRIGTVQFQSYSGDGAKAGLKLLPLAILAGEGCNDAGTACIVSNGAVLEAGANLSQLLKGSGDRFKGIRITTPEDSVVGTLSHVVDSEEGGCVQEISGLNHLPQCTANDISLTEIVQGTLQITGGSNCGHTPSATNPLGCICESTADTIEFEADGRFVLTSEARYDIGLYIATDENNGNGAASGQCTRFSWSPDSPLFNADQDACGDINDRSDDGVELHFGPVEVPCQDTNDDNLVEVNHCETWANSADQIGDTKVCRGGTRNGEACTGQNQCPGSGASCAQFCSGAEDVQPGTTSKCNCGVLPGVCIAVANPLECKENFCATVCVDTANDPIPIECSEDADCPTGGECLNAVCVDTENEPILTECSVDAECAASVGGTCRDTLLTRNRTGNCNGTPSGDCDAQDVCVDGLCPDKKATDGISCGDSTLCDPKACLAGTCTPGTSVTCPSPAECFDQGACDPLTGNCSRPFSDPGDPCGDSTESGCGPTDCCDNPDTCDGSGNCQDNLEPITTVCRARVNSCDQDETCTAQGTCGADLCVGDETPVPFP